MPYRSSVAPTVTRTATRTVTATLACALAVALAACGSGATASPDGPGTTGSTATTVPAGGRGWIGGEPDWGGGRSGGDRATGSPAPEVMSSKDDRGRPASAESADGGGGSPRPTAPGDAQGPGLRAGSVDDNARFEDFLAYLDRLDQLGITTRPFDATGRIVVEVVDGAGRPAAGVEVTVSAANGGAAAVVPVATLRTTAHGLARFLPAQHGASGATSFTLSALGSTATASPGTTARLTVQPPARRGTAIPVDIMFLLDATGSMGDEIERLKTTIDSVAARIAQFESQPDVRLGMTLYRDEGDSFVTSTYDLTDDVDAFRAALGKVEAGGGGDYPEALDEALAEVLAAPSWRDPATTLQLVFLVADAPPQIERQVDTPYTDSITDAVSRGITVIPIASSNSDDIAEAVFRQIAQATGGRFVFLSYGAGGAATGENTDIDSTDYEELSLDDLVVRLVAEELSALTGTKVVIPPPPSTITPTTRPQGQ